MRTARFAIIEDTDHRIVIQDLGPWDKHPTITNDAEGVVERLAPMLKGRRLFYIDSEGQMDELAVDAHLGTFAGFRSGKRILAGTADISGQPSGTSMKYRLHGGLGDV